MCPAKLKHIHLLIIKYTFSGYRPRITDIFSRGAKILWHLYKPYVFPLLGAGVDILCQYFRQTVEVVCPTGGVWCFLCSLSTSSHPPPPVLPEPLHYSSSLYPHRQPLTDEEAGRRNVSPYYTVHMSSSVSYTHHMLREICLWIFQTVQR